MNFQIAGQSPQKDDIFVCQGGTGGLFFNPDMNRNGSVKVDILAVNSFLDMGLGLWHHRHHGHDGYGGSDGGVIMDMDMDTDINMDINRDINIDINMDKNVDMDVDIKLDTLWRARQPLLTTSKTRRRRPRVI